MKKMKTRICLSFFVVLVTFVLSQHVLAESGKGGSMPEVVTSKTTELLVLQDMNEKQLIAVVTQRDDGSLTVHAADKALGEEVTVLLKTLAKETLPLRGGGPVETDQGTTGSVSTVKNIEPGDPKYLSALWDAVKREKSEINGRRIIASTAEMAQ